VNTLAEIEAAVEALPQEPKGQLLAFLAVRIGRTLDRSDARNSSAVRRAGLHAGTWRVTPDFDAPLPDEFWLGRDA
jgi:hypothetical protein